MDDAQETKIWLGRLWRHAGFSRCFVKCDLWGDVTGEVIPIGNVSVRMRRRWSRRKVIGRIRCRSQSFVVRGERRVWTIRRTDAEGAGATITFAGRYYVCNFGPVRVSAGEHAVDVRLPLIAHASHEAEFRLVGSEQRGWMRLSPEPSPSISSSFPREGCRLFRELGGMEHVPDGEREALVSGLLALLLFRPWIRQE